MPKYMSDTEHKILRKLLEVARHYGYEPEWVDDGGDVPEPIATDDDVIEAVDAVEFSAIRFSRNPDEGFIVTVIIGNGVDIISDYSAREADYDKVDDLLNEVQGYAESLGG